MFVTKNKKHLFMFMPALLLFRLLGPSFQPPCKRPNPTSAKDRWCNFDIVPPLQIPNKTSSNLLENLVVLPLTHVQNLARCSIVWNAKTPFLVFWQKGFPRCTNKNKIVSRAVRYFFSTRSHFVVDFKVSSTLNFFRVLPASLAVFLPKCSD